MRSECTRSLPGACGVFEREWGIQGGDGYGVVVGEMLVSPPRLPCFALLVFAARSRAGVVTGGGDGEAPGCGKNGWLVVWGATLCRTRGRRLIKLDSESWHKMEKQADANAGVGTNMRNNGSDQEKTKRARKNA